MTLPLTAETYFTIAAMESSRLCDSSLLTRLIHVGAPKVSFLQKTRFSAHCGVVVQACACMDTEVLIAIVLLILWSTDLPTAKNFDLLDLFAGVGNASKYWRPHCIRVRPCIICARIVLGILLTKEIPGQKSCYRGDREGRVYGFPI